MASSQETIRDISSAYCEIGEKGGKPGMRGPEMRALERMLAARTSDMRTYSRGDKGQGTRDKGQGTTLSHPP